MKTDKESRNIIVCAIIAVLLFLGVFIGCQANKTNARLPEDAIMTYRDKMWYEETLRAYNHILHRIWIDRPNYVEDVLSETDEFYELDSLLNSHWEDTFEFYNTQDSIEYHQNWFREHSLDPGCEEIPEIPSRTTLLLLKVFGNGN